MREHHDRDPPDAIIAAIRAREAGLIGDDHLLGEIGQVFAGDLDGRRTAEDVTLYKSLGSVVQDLAAAEHIVAKLS